MLNTITGYLSMSPMERLSFCLERRRRSFFSIYGSLAPEVQEAVGRAVGAIESESADAAELVGDAIVILKQGFI
jgi:hypothetical protein